MNAADERSRRAPRVLGAVATAAPLLIALTPMMLGGAIREAHAAVVLLASGLALAAVLSARPRRFPPGSRVVAAVLAIFVLVPAVQVLPLPCGIVARLADRERVDFVRDVARIASAVGPRCMITLDRGGTFAALGTAGAILAAFVVGASTAYGATGRRRIVFAITVGATTVAAVTFLHEALSLHRVYGLYEPRFASYAHVGPLLNANHLALFASLGFLSSGYLLFVDRRPQVRAALAVAAAVDVAMTVATHSRGGLLTLVLAALVLVAVVTIRSRTRSSVAPGPIAIGIAALLGFAALFVAIEWDAIAAEFVHAPLKTQLIVGALRASANVGWLGVGRGAFAAFFAPESSDAGRAMVPENLVAQWADELGPTIGILAALAIVVEIVRAVRSARAGSATILCAIAALMMLHDLADFAIELPALGSVFGLCLGAGLARRQRRSQRDSDPDVSRRTIAPVLAIALLGSASGVAFGFTSDLESALEAARRQRSEGRLAASDRTLLAALVDHAFEPVVTLELAANAVGRRDDATIRWANLAMRRAPRWDSPHLVLADHFFRTGRNAQAIAELAAVSDLGRRRAAETVCRHAAVPIDPVRLARVVPTTGDATEMANVLRRCLGHARFLALVEAAIESGRSDPSLDRLAIETVAAIEGWAAADRRYRVAEARHPRDVDVLLEGARVAIGLRDGPTTLARASRAKSIRGPTIAIETVRAPAAALAQDRRSLDEALAFLRREADAGRYAHDRLAAVEAESDELRGDIDAAFASRMRGYEATQSPDWLLAIEALAIRHGRTVRAEDAIRRLCHDHATHPRCGQPRESLENSP